MLRHTAALGASQIGQTHLASMNVATAEALALKSGDVYLGVPIDITDTVADQCVFVSSNQATIGGL